MTYQIIFADEKTEYRAEEGMTVLDAQIAAGLRPTLSAAEKEPAENAA